MNQETVLELSTSYSQKENSISKKISRMIMEMVRVTILEKGIENTLWPEIILVITDIKNLQLT